MNETATTSVEQDLEVLDIGTIIETDAPSLYGLILGDMDINSQVEGTLRAVQAGSYISDDATGVVQFDYDMYITLLENLVGVLQRDLHLVGMATNSIMANTSVKHSNAKIDSALQDLNKYLLNYVFRRFICWYLFYNNATHEQNKYITDTGKLNSRYELDTARTLYNYIPDYLADKYAAWFEWQQAVVK